MLGQLNVLGIVFDKLGQRQTVYMRRGHPHVKTRRQDRYTLTSPLRNQFRLATVTARATPETPNPRIKTLAVRNYS